MLDTEIRERLADYLDDEISLGQFEEWFIPETWDVERERNEMAADLTRSIMRLLVMCSNGDLSEDELRRELLRIRTRTYWVDQSPKPVVLTSGATVIRQEGSAQAGTSRSVASV
jgi:hypothetical protein